MNNEPLFLEDFEVAIPIHAAEVGRWLRKKGLQETLIEIFVENSVDGQTLRTMTAKDVRDIFPTFLKRKKLRDWVTSLVSKSEELSSDSPPCRAKSASTSGASLILDDSQSSSDILDSDDLSEVVGPSVASSEPLTLPLMSTPISGQSTSGKSELKRSLFKRSSCGTSSLNKIPRLSVDQRQQGETLPSLATAGDVKNGDLGTLFANLNLAVPSSIKKCRTKGLPIPNKSRLEMIKNSLIILQAHIGPREKPTNAEFETCAEKIVHMVPELKDPLPPIRRDAFKQWATVLIQLKKAYYNTKAVEHPRKKGSPEFETELMQESHDEQLKTEMKKRSRTKKKNQSLMVASFEKRRNWILSLKRKPTTKQIIKEYPALERYDQIILKHDAK